MKTYPQNINNGVISRSKIVHSFLALIVKIHLSNRFGKNAKNKEGYPFDEAI